MKKIKLVALVVMLAFLVTVPGFVNTVDAAPEVKVTIDGKYVSFPDQKPYIDKNNRTLVPVRAPMEQMGCTVDWDNNTRQAIIEKNGIKAVFTIDSKTYTVNGVKKTMDTQAVITNSRTAFPIKYAAEAMGATVGWDDKTYTVLITTDNNTEVKTVDLGSSSGVQDVEADGYAIKVGNHPDDPTMFISIGDGSRPPQRIRVVCTSHPEFNTCHQPGMDGNWYTLKKDVWTNDYMLFREGYTSNPKSGMTVTFDIYGGYNGDKNYTGEKIATIQKILP